MKVICLLCDSLNRHFLSAYGNGLAETPNIDWLAKRSFVFNKHFSGSVPTMPTRREVWTGNYEFLWRPWGALEPWDRDLPGILKKNDILTMLITDSYHLYERGSGNYHVNFEGWEFFRGFEHDPWVTEPTDTPEHSGNLTDRYARNMKRMIHEDDFPSSKTLCCVEQWLQKNNTHENFFLMIDEFAPHEPFHTPQYYIDKYDPDYKGPLLFWPSYGKDKHTERELQHLRARYCAHVEFLDKYIGRVFETMTELDLWKDTAFILMTDHGHFLGEHGYTGKPKCPQFNTLVHIPFMMYVPGYEGNGKTIDALTANIDIFTTILDLFGVQPETSVHGRSMLPLVEGKADKIRDHALYGYFGQFINITDGHKTYMRPPVSSDAELYVYSLRWEFGFFTGGVPNIGDELEVGRFMKNVDMPMTRMPTSQKRLFDKLFETDKQLYDIDKDPDQKNNLAGSEEERKYESLLRKALDEVDCPQEQYRRIGL